MDQKDTYRLLNRLDDYIDASRYKYTINATRFLNPYEQSVLIDRLKSQHDICYRVYGGYANSERNIIIISPADYDNNISDYLSLVKITFTKYDEKYLNHRMILGSVLALGITRDGIGDIIIDATNSCAYVIATNKMTQYIDQNLVQVARAHVSTNYIEDTSAVNLDISKPKLVTGTVASLRIDCILALGLNTSRSKAGGLIKEQMVFINWQMVNKSTVIANEADKITIRKKGRIIVSTIGNTSKKNRIWVELAVYS